MDNIEIEHFHQHRKFYWIPLEKGSVFLCTHHEVSPCQVFAHASAQTPTLPPFHLGDSSRLRSGVISKKPYLKP